jgi:hypothetical protein
MTIRLFDPRQRIAAFGQKACAEFTQKGRKSDRRFWCAGHWGVTSTFPPWCDLGPLQPWGPLFVQHSERNGGCRDPDTRG